MKRIVVAALVAVVALVAVAANPASADPNGDVRAAMLKLAALNSYEMTAGSGQRSFVMDVVKPDAMRMHSGGMEIVRIGTTTYMKMPGQSKWTKTESTRGRSVGTEMADQVRKLSSEPQGIVVRDLGVKNVDGQNMRAYEITQKNAEKAVCYIGSDGYIHRMDPKGRSSSEPIRFSKFNAVAPIHAPM